MGEHLPCKQGVESSNLLVSIAGARPAGRTLKTEYHTTMNKISKTSKR